MPLNDQSGSQAIQFTEHKKGRGENKQGIPDEKKTTGRASSPRDCRSRTRAGISCSSLTRALQTATDYCCVVFVSTRLLRWVAVFNVLLQAKVIQGFAYEGAAADVWSLGVTLYAMLAGYLPFEAESLPAVFNKAQVRRKKRPLSRVRC